MSFKWLSFKVIACSKAPYGVGGLYLPRTIAHLVKKAVIQIPGLVLPTFRRLIAKLVKAARCRLPST